MKEALTIEEIHKETLNLLKRIIEICDDLKINYYVAYGSLLGAVRHKGFIPWDDDFDIIMLRDDYDIFIKYCEKNKDVLMPYKILNRNTLNDYPYNISRFSDTRFEMKCTNGIKIDMGLFIDIYPYDKTNNVHPSIILKKKKMLMYCSISAVTDKYIKDGNNFMKNLIRKLLFLFSHKLGVEFFLDKFDKLKEKYYKEDSNIISCLVWDATHHAIPLEYYSDYVELDFEDIKVKAPVKYDEILKEAYNNYWELPPIEKRVFSHDYNLYRK